MAVISPPKEKELEVHFKADSGKAVIEGKTTIPFQAFVTLILQRKVFALFKDWGKEPVIISSELLTSLASAPQDSVENRGRIVMVSLGVGILTGISLFALLLAGLVWLNVGLGVKEFLLIGGGILGAALLIVLVMRLQKMRRGSEKIVEAMEGVASFLSK